MQRSSYWIAFALLLACGAALGSELEEEEQIGKPNLDFESLFESYVHLGEILFDDWAPDGSHPLGGRIKQQEAF